VDEEKLAASVLEDGVLLHRHEDAAVPDRRSSIRGVREDQVLAPRQVGNAAPIFAQIADVPDHIILSDPISPVSFNEVV
jgi:hypothetical protein